MPGTDGADAFCQNWTTELNWLVPPPRLIVQYIRNMEDDKAQGTLVVPFWTSAVFWPCIISDENRFKRFIVDCKTLPKQGTVGIGRGNNGVFSKNPLPFNMLALKLNFVT